MVQSRNHCISSGRSLSGYRPLQLRNANVSRSKLLLTVRMYSNSSHAGEQSSIKKCFNRLIHQSFNIYILCIYFYIDHPRLWKILQFIVIWLYNFRFSYEGSGGSFSHFFWDGGLAQSQETHPTGFLMESTGAGSSGGVGTSGTKPLLPGRESSPVPSISPQGSNWIEECYGNQGEGATSQPIEGASSQTIQEGQASASYLPPNHADEYNRCWDRFELIMEKRIKMYTETKNFAKSFPNLDKRSRNYRELAIKIVSDEK